MDPPKLYHYIKASGLLEEEALDRVLEGITSNDPNFWQIDPFLTDLSAEPVDRRHFQKLARIRDLPRAAPVVGKDEESGDDSDATLDGENTHLKMDGITELDRRLADELIRRGFLNHWQSIQLLSGRTRFTLGDYRVLDAIGRGGYGHVFLGSERTQKPYRYVALKVLPLSRSTPELTERFRHEIEVQKNLSHLNLVRYLGSGQEGKVHFMVHEFVDGGDLRELFRHEGVLPIEVAAPVIGQIARAVHYLHENGIVHRDIKPANVLLSSAGFAKLTDMGLSVKIDSGTATGEAISKVAGTVDYMAPDQIARPGEPATSWDVYSLGCTLYQLLTGSVPFPDGNSKQKFQERLRSNPKDPRILNQAIPYDIVDLLRKMLTRKPADRITAREVAERLDAWTPGTGLAYRIAFGEAETPVAGPPQLGFTRR